MRKSIAILHDVRAAQGPPDQSDTLVEAGAIAAAARELGLDDDSIVDAVHVARTIERRRAEHGGDWFAEQYVPGRELNVALLAERTGPRVLPVAEIRFDAFPAAKPRIVGYAAKWHTASFEYRNTTRSFAVERELAARVGRLAGACWELFRLDGYAPVRFRVDPRGVPKLLEV